jgi:hypothetical protein
MQTMWQINYTSFNLALNWSQLCIVPARQRYIRQYGKMASRLVKALFELVFHKTKSVVTVQRQFRRKYGKSSASQPSIHTWYKRFVTKGCVCIKAKAPANRLWVQSVLKPFNNRLCVVLSLDFFLCGFVKDNVYVPATTDNTTWAQDTDQRGLCRHWSGNSPQRVAGGLISVWCCSSHSWCLHWILLMTNYCS